MNSPTAYLSGPMTGIPLLNKPAFDEAAAVLRSKGWVVLNPLEIRQQEKTTWEIALRIDLMVMLVDTCRTIVMLPGWEASRGAKLEHHVADSLGFTVYRYCNGVLR